MHDATNLKGHIILLVEDDFFIASDTAAVLVTAGADILGPCSNERDAHALLDATPPTSVILDINLGGGSPRFGLARLLFERRVPFMFFSGYEPDIVPADLRSVPWVQKPATADQVVNAVRHLHAPSVRQ